jgi:Ca-activated chloride channel family protein
MTFRSATILWALAALPLVILFLVIRESLRTRIARRFASERLRGVAAPIRLLRPWLMIIALGAAVVALAGPYSGFTLVPVMAREANRVIVLDVSSSMGADDVGASRLSSAKAIAMRLVESQQGRVSLIVFELQPAVVSPLTTDTTAVASLIDTVVTGEVGQPGSDIGSALIGAMRVIESDIAQKPDIVLISDGEEQGARLTEAIQRAKTLGVQISTITIGNPTGSTILTDRGPLRDTSGEVVTTYARPDVMGRIASETGGRALVNPFGADALQPLVRSGAGGTERETHARVPIDRFQWPLGLSFVLLITASLLHRGAE